MLHGLRRSEILAITKSDIDFEKKEIHINKILIDGLDGEKVRNRNKSAAGTRTVITNDEILKIIKKQPGERLVPLTGRKLTADWIKIKRELNLKSTFHGLRHFYATTLLQLGVNDKIAMEMLGHSSTSMLKRYQHTVDKDRRKSAKVINLFAEEMQRFCNTTDEEPRKTEAKSS